MRNKGIDRAVGGLVCGKSRESRGKLKGWGAATLVDPECPAGGSCEQGAGSERAPEGQHQEKRDIPSPSAGTAQALTW